MDWPAGERSGGAGPARGWVGGAPTGFEVPTAMASGDGAASLAGERSGGAAWPGRSASGAQATAPSTPGGGRRGGERGAVCYTAPVPIIFSPTPVPTVGPVPLMTDEEFLKQVAKSKAKQAENWLIREEATKRKAAERRAHIVTNAGGGDLIADIPDDAWLDQNLFERYGKSMFEDVVDASLALVSAYPVPSGTTPGIRWPGKNSGNFPRAGSNSWSRGKGGVYTRVAGQRARRGSPATSGGLRRSENLSGGWRRTPGNFWNGDLGEAYNDVSYAGFVHGLQQSGVMKRRGWRTVDAVAGMLGRMSWDGLVTSYIRLFLATGYGIFTKGNDADN